ncbi:MAG TPA: hypothetical protein PLE74_01020 [Candidatus Cloacimonadota bacterium]|nr:hypothetical protein [Candidatus Cloacimonadota bacterium]
MIKDIYVESIPNCDICGKKPGIYDARMSGRSTWANMCEDCMTSHGDWTVGSKRIIQGKPSIINNYSTVNAVACDSLEEIVESGIQTVMCPLCKIKKRVEADANYSYRCKCGAEVIVSPNF